MSRTILAALLIFFAGIRKALVGRAARVMVMGPKIDRNGEPADRFH
jgi:hypothetical protein